MMTNHAIKFEIPFGYRQNYNFKYFQSLKIIYSYKEMENYLYIYKFDANQNYKLYSIELYGDHVQLNYDDKKQNHDEEIYLYPRENNELLVIHNDINNLQVQFFILNMENNNIAGKLIIESSFYKNPTPSLHLELASSDQSVYRFADSGKIMIIKVDQQLQQCEQLFAEETEYLGIRNCSNCRLFVFGVSGQKHQYYKLPLALNSPYATKRYNLRSTIHVQYSEGGISYKLVANYYRQSNVTFVSYCTEGKGYKRDVIILDNLILCQFDNYQAFSIRPKNKLIRSTKIKQIIKTQSYRLLCTNNYDDDSDMSQEEVCKQMFLYDIRTGKQKNLPKKRKYAFFEQKQIIEHLNDYDEGFFIMHEFSRGLNYGTK